MRRTGSLVLSGFVAALLTAFGAYLATLGAGRFLGDFAVPVSAALIGATGIWWIQGRQGRPPAFLYSLAGGYIGIVLLVYGAADLYPFPIDQRASAGHIANLLAALVAHGLSRGLQTRTHDDQDPVV